MSPNQDDLLTVEEAARLLKVSARTVTRYRQQGKLPYHRYTKRTIKYRRADVLLFLNHTYNAPSLFDL